MGTMYASTNLEIQRVVDACNRAADRGEPIGLDTEFYGLEVGKQSTVGRAKLHLLSIAVKRHPLSIAPRGYHVSDAAVFTQEALGNDNLRRCLEGPGEKCVHNLPVDAHTLANEGIVLGGGINTLATARWAWPERARAEGFTLDSLGEDLVGLGKTEGFREIFSEMVTEYRSTFRRVSRCECGGTPCRKRSTTSGHTRLISVEETRHPRDVVKAIPLESVVPGHPRWARAVDYAARDAILALAVWDLAQRAMMVEREIPWLKQ